MNATTTRTPARSNAARASEPPAGAAYFPDGDPLRPSAPDHTLYACRRCHTTWSAWDLVVNLDVHGLPELCCPDCAIREALEDAVDLDALADLNEAV